MNLNFQSEFIGIWIFCILFDSHISANLFTFILVTGVINFHSIQSLLHISFVSFGVEHSDCVNSISDVSSSCCWSLSNFHLSCVLSFHFFFNESVSCLIFVINVFVSFSFSGKKCILCLFYYYLCFLLFWSHCAAFHSHSYFLFTTNATWTFKNTNFCLTQRTFCLTF